MAEYIDRAAAIERLAKLMQLQPSTARAIIEAIPAADVRPAVKSKWDDNRVAFYRGCPECGAFVRANLDEVFLRDFPSAVGRLNYCPNCGADMREKSR